MESTTTTPERDPYLWKQAKARVGFRMHLQTYLLVNAGLWLIWALTSFAFQSSGHHGFIFPWPFFPMIGWGIGLASHYFAVYRNREHNLIEEEYRKLVNQQG
ncbi:2TM domain-containing protein [Spirosoma endophyticum]|uniref:2TM domain-containing protein n=1 Tax=Spirosoma endophyticum TaxID=662367 RepID=A0A1I2CVZ7_9BACT|nr:2TM domain-containing protein [Spirosoma endophyticum]SFE72466.1 2TM domain-containing protein [Spirosoma endophyticum]